MDLHRVPRVVAWGFRFYASTTHSNTIRVDKWACETPLSAAMSDNVSRLRLLSLIVFSSSDGSTSHGIIGRYFKGHSSAQKFGPTPALHCIVYGEV